MALLPWRKGVVTRIENETATTRRFWIQTPEPFNFIPGQFVTLDLPIHEKPNKRWRSYSISSWPGDTDTFELIIVLNREGLGTQYLFEQVTVGSELSFRGPQGVFTLQEPLSNELFFICTGVGIAPFRSMIHHIKNRRILYNKINLVFGCRTKADLLYYDELRRLEQTMPGFRYIPVLSREEWEGETGYVHHVYEALCAARQPAGFYLCGWRAMIDDARKRIQDMGYGKKDVHTEIYG